MTRGTAARTEARGAAAFVASLARLAVALVAFAALAAFAAAPTCASYAAIAALARVAALADVPPRETDADASAHRAPARGALALERELRRTPDAPSRAAPPPPYLARATRLAAATTGACIPNEAATRAHPPRRPREALMVFLI